MRRAGPFLKKIFSRLFSTKRPFKLTRPGWVFILYSIGVGAGAINTGNNLLYIVFGIFLGLLLASGFLSDLSLWGLDVTWILPDTLRAGERSDVWMTVTNTKRFWPSLGVSIILEGTLSGQPVRFSAYAPCVRKSEAVRLPASWTPLSRGEFVLKQVRVSTRYPFGLLEKWWSVYRGTPAATALVQPALIPVFDQVLWDALRGDDRASTRVAHHEGSSSSTVRDYHLGDNPHRIHWKASAKRGLIRSDFSRPAWLVRQMEPEEQHRVILELPQPLEMAAATHIEAEALVSFTASLSHRLWELGWSVEVVLGRDRVLAPDVLFALWNPPELWTRGAIARAESNPRQHVLVREVFEHSLLRTAA